MTLSLTCTWPTSQVRTDTEHRPGESSETPERVTTKGTVLSDEPEQPISARQGRGQGKARLNSKSRFRFKVVCDATIAPQPTIEKIPKQRLTQ